MAYPAPAGHVSLPPKPPISASSTARASHAGFKPAFTAFAPRNVNTSSSAKAASLASFAPTPTSIYGAQSTYTAGPHPNHPTQSTYENRYQEGLQIKNPFVQTAIGDQLGSTPLPAYDPEYDAQIQQWQSAYNKRDDRSTHGIAKTVTTSAKAEPSANGTEAQRTVQREGGGTKWTDSTLLEWDPAHFRIFVGNLAGEVTDDSLLKAFIKYPSVQKARVIRDKRTTKSKGFGFVSFADGDDYFQAARDMQGKYIGSHPVLIKRAVTEVKPTVVQDKHKHKNKKGRGGGGGPGNHEQVDYGGIQKKVPKTKGGLRVIG